MNFETFLYETYFRREHNKDFEARLTESLLRSSILLEAERVILQNALDENYHHLFFSADPLNEVSLLNKVADKVKDLTQKVKEKGKEALSAGQQALLKIGGGIQGIIKLILSKVQGVLQNGISAVRGAAKKIAKDAVSSMEKSLKIAAEDPKRAEVIAKDLSNGQSDASKGVSYVSGGFVKGVGKASVEAAKDDDSPKQESVKIHHAYQSLYEDAFIFMIESQEISREDLLNLHSINEEDVHIPYLTSLLKKLHKYPPFNKFEKIKEEAGKYGQSLLKKLSYYISQLAGGGGPYEYPWLGDQTGKFVAGKLLHKIDPSRLAKKGVELLIISMVPFLGIVFTIMKWSIILLEFIGMALTAFMTYAEKAGKKAPEWARDLSQTIKDYGKDDSKEGQPATEKSESAWHSFSLKDYKTWSIKK